MENNFEHRLRDAEGKTTKENVVIKKMEAGKASLQKIIESLLDYISRPIQAVVSFQ